MVCERSDVFASSCAIARAFPIFSRRSTASRRTDKKHVTVEFLIVGNDSSSLHLAELEVLMFLVQHSSVLCGFCCSFKAFLLFSVSPTLLMEFDWQLASWTHHAMR